MREVATLLCVFAPGRLVSRLLLAVCLGRSRAVCFAVARLAAREAGSRVQALTHLLFGQAGDARRATTRRSTTSAGAVTRIAATLALHGVQKLLVHLAQLSARDWSGIGWCGVAVAQVVITTSVGVCGTSQRAEVLHDAEVHGPAVEELVDDACEAY
jgi:hypothetical protein